MAGSVNIDFAAIERFSESYTPNGERWWQSAPISLPLDDLESIVGILLAFNAISFCYWGDPRWSVTYRGSEFDGTWAMTVCFARQLERDPTFFIPEVLSRLNLEGAEEFFEGRGVIPLLEERLNFLRTVGRVTSEVFQGRYAKLIEESEWNSEKLLKALITCYGVFEDTALYSGLRVFFQKRAQLLVADLDCHLRSSGKRGLTGVETLTACADYKVPQALRYLDIISYSEPLHRKIETGVPLLAGSMEEVEIRAMTIHAIELLRDCCSRYGVEVTPMELNDYFWLSTQGDNRKMEPYHLVRTTAY